MDIYEDNGTQGVLDFGKAKHELEATSRITGETTRRERYAELTAAALLDVAYSLRSVGAEASMALLGSGFLAGTDAEPEPVVDDPNRPLEVGDLVHVLNDTEPGEVVAVLVTEDEPAADIAFANGSSLRLFQRDLVRLRGGDGLDPEFVAEVAQRVAEATGEPAAPVGEDAADDLDDDLDDDFGGDFGGDTFTAAESALDTLKASEAARKAAKKKGGKK